MSELTPEQKLEKFNQFVDDARELERLHERESEIEDDLLENWRQLKGNRELTSFSMHGGELERLAAELGLDWKAGVFWDHAKLKG